MNSEPEIPYARVAAFVRQHTHDVRNEINSLELETALLQELVLDEEARACVERVRRQVRAMGGQMRALAARFEEPQPDIAPIAARELFLIFKEQKEGVPKPLEVKWVDELDSERVSVDAAMMATGFHELLANAAHFPEGGTATASARREGEEIIFELREPKAGPLDPSTWGEPFSTTRRGGYGLGLWSARRLVVAGGGTFAQHHAPAEGALITRIAMPVCK